MKLNQWELPCFVEWRCPHFTLLLRQYRTIGFSRQWKKKTQSTKRLCGQPLCTVMKQLALMSWVFVSTPEVLEGSMHQIFVLWKVTIMAISSLKKTISSHLTVHFLFQVVDLLKEQQAANFLGRKKPLVLVGIPQALFFSILKMDHLCLNFISYCLADCLCHFLP